jgi:hypothetical protein
MILTSVNLRREQREILRRVMEKEGLSMGASIRHAINRLGESYKEGAKPEAAL